MLGKEGNNKNSYDTLGESPTFFNTTEQQTDNGVIDLSIAGKELKEKVKEYQELRQDHFQDQKKKEMDEYQHQIEEKRLQLGRKMRQFKFSISKIQNQTDLRNSQEDLFKEIYELFYIQDETNSFYEQMFIYFIGEQNDSKNTIMNLFNEIEAKIKKIQEEKEFFKTQFLSSRVVQSEQKLLTSEKDQEQINYQSDSQNKVMIKENQQMKAIIDHKEQLIRQLKQKIAHKNLYQYENQLDQLKEKVKYISLFASFKNKEKFFQERIEMLKNDIKNNVKVDLAEELNQKLDQLKYSNILTKFKEQRPEKRSVLYANQKIEIKSLKKRVAIDIKKIAQKKSELKKMLKTIKKNDGILLNYTAEIKMLKTLLNQMNDVPKVYKMIEDVKTKQTETIQENENLTKKVEKLKKQINEHQKELGTYYVKNLQSIKKLGSFSRIHLSKTSKIKIYLQRKMKDIEENCLFQLIDQGQTEDIHDHFKALKLIHHCLNKQVINDIGLPKLLQKRKKIKKKNQTEKFGNDFRKKIDELRKSADREIKQLKEMVGQKEDTMKKIATVINQMTNIKNQLDSDLDEQEILNKNLIQQKEEIQNLNYNLSKNQETLAEYEKKLQLEIENNQNKEQEVQKLSEQIQNQKKILKDIQKQKKNAEKQIKENEDLIKQKNEKIREIKAHLEKLKKINQELKNNLNIQYQKIQKLIEESKNKFVLLEDLTKKDKIFHQLFEIQDKKILTKDKKIQTLEQKIVNHQNLIEALLKDKIDGNKGLSEKLSKNLPSQLKKEEKQLQKLKKDFSKASKEIASLQKKLENEKNKNRTLRVSLVKTDMGNNKKTVNTNLKTKANKKLKEMESVRNNKNYAKKLSMKKSFTGKGKLESDNDRKLQNNDTLKNINKISSRKSIQESCLTLSLDNNDEDSFSSINQKKKINKSSQVNFEKNYSKVQKYYIEKVDKFNILLQDYMKQTQAKLDTLRDKINKAQVLKQTLLKQQELLDQQSKKLKEQFNDFFIELQLNQKIDNNQSSNLQLQKELLLIFKENKSSEVVSQLSNLLSNYNIQEKEEKQQLKKNESEYTLENLESMQDQQENNDDSMEENQDLSDDQSNKSAKEDEEKYQSLQRQLKNQAQPESKILKEKKADVFSFSNKVKKEESICDPNAKNLFLDDTMNQSSMNQSVQKLNKHQLQKIEEDSELFNQTEDSEDIDYFNGGKQNDLMPYDQSVTESQIDDSIQIEQKPITKKKEVEIKNDIKEELLGSFENGNMFSFSKGYKQFKFQRIKFQAISIYLINDFSIFYIIYNMFFVIYFIKKVWRYQMNLKRGTQNYLSQKITNIFIFFNQVIFKIFIMIFYNKHMEKILVEFLLKRFICYQQDQKHINQISVLKDLVIVILSQNQTCLQTIETELKTKKNQSQVQGNLSLTSQQKTYYQKKINLFENFRQKMVKIFNQYTDEILTNNSSLKQIFIAYKDHLELMQNLNLIVKQNKDINQIVNNNISDKTSENIPKQFQRQDSKNSRIQFPKSSRKESTERKFQRNLSVQKLNELDPYRKYSQLTNRILKATLEETQNKEIIQVMVADDKSCPGGGSRENFLMHFNQVIIYFIKISNLQNAILSIKLNTTFNLLHNVYNIKQGKNQKIQKIIMNNKTYSKLKSNPSRLEQMQIYINDKLDSEYSFLSNGLETKDLMEFLDNQIQLVFEKNKVKFERKEGSSSAQGQSLKINFNRLNQHTCNLNFTNSQTKNIYNIFKKILKIFEIYTQTSNQNEHKQKIDILMELFQKMMDDMKEGLGEKIESLNTLFKLDLYGIQLEQELKDKKMINKRKELLLKLQNQKRSIDNRMKIQRQLSEQNLSNMSINCNEDAQGSINDSHDRTNTGQKQINSQSNCDIRNRKILQTQQIFVNYQYAQNKMTNLFAIKSERDLNKNNYILLDKEKMELSDQFDEFIRKNMIKHSLVQIHDKKKIIKRIKAFQNKFFKAISEQILNDCDIRERINSIEKNLLRIIQKIKLLGNKKDLIREIQIQKQEIQILQQKLKITGNVSHEIKKLNNENSELRKDNEELQLEYKVLQSRFELIQSSKECNMLDENYSVSEDDQLDSIPKNEKSIIEQKIQKYNDGLSNLDAVAEEQSDYEKSLDSIKVNKNFFSTKLYEIYFNYNFNQQKQGAIMKKSRSTVFCQDQIFKSLYKKDESGAESPHLQIPNFISNNQRSKSFSLPKFLDNLDAPEPKVTSIINKKTINTNIKVKINKLKNISNKLRKLRPKLALLSQIKRKSKNLQAKLKVFKKRKIIQKIENKSDFESLSSYSNMEKPKSAMDQLKLLVKDFAKQNNLNFSPEKDFQNELNHIIDSINNKYQKSKFGQLHEQAHESISSHSKEETENKNRLMLPQTQFRQTDISILQKAFVSLSEILQNLTSNVNFLQKKFKENHREKLTNEILLNIQKNIQQLKKQTKLVKYFILDQRDQNKSEQIDNEFHQLTSSNYQPLMYQESQEHQGPKRTFSAPRNKDLDHLNPKLVYESSIYDQNSQKNFQDSGMQKYPSCLDLLQTMSMTEIPNNESNLYSTHQDNLSLDDKIEFLMKIASQLFPVKENKLQFVKSQILENFYNPNYLERSLRNSIPQSDTSTKKIYEREDLDQNDLIKKLKENIKSLENQLRNKEDQQKEERMLSKYKEKEAKLVEQNKKLKKQNMVYQRRNKNMIATINGKNQTICVLEKDKQELETKFTELQVELDHLMESQEYQGIQQNKNQKSLIQVLKLENKKLSEQVDELETQIESIKSKNRKKIQKLKKDHSDFLKNLSRHKSELLIKQSKELQQMDSLKRQQAQKTQAKSKRLIEAIKSDIKPKRNSTLLTKSMLYKGQKYQIILK